MTRHAAAVLGMLFLAHVSMAQLSQQGSKLVGTGAVGTNVYQGYSAGISADGNTALIGGLGDNSGAGAVWVYARSGEVWSQQGSKLVGTGTVGAAAQGFSVAISADATTAIVGGPSDDSSAGAAWVFTSWLRGDANGDGQVNVQDVFYLINYLFAGGPAPV